MNETIKNFGFYVFNLSEEEPHLLNAWHKGFQVDESQGATAAVTQALAEWDLKTGTYKIAVVQENLLRLFKVTVPPPSRATFADIKSID